MYVKRLEAIGISREQAELQVQVMADIVDNNYATKQDVKDFRTEVKFEFDKVRYELKELRTELKNDMQRLEDRLTIKLGSMMVVTVSALAAIIKLL
jgi:hypothetical protein